MFETPTNDIGAAHRAATFIGDLPTSSRDQTLGFRVGEKVTAEFAVTYERYVNKNGTPVRRLVLVGPEEVDGAALRDVA
jgi:hypothetical protein